jgi:hypothetical protein
VSLINRSVHALAIAGTIATVFGLVGLRRQLGERRGLGDAGLVAYGFGAVAVMFAAIASGFVATQLAGYMIQAGGEAVRATWEPLLDYNFAVNQANTKVFVVAGSAGITLFSLAMMRIPRFGRALGLTGLVVGTAAIVATISGLRMDIHGFGAIVLGHGIWLIWTGTRLLQPGGPREPSALS